MFLAEGYDGTSIEAVAARAGVPRTTLYKRFPDKPALLKAVVAQRMGQWSDMARAIDTGIGNDPEERLRYYCILMLRAATQPEVRAIRNLARQVGGAPDWPDHEVMLATLAGAIAECARARGRAAQAPEAVARLLMAMVAGWADGWHAPEVIGIADARATARAMVRLVIDGADGW